MAAKRTKTARPLTPADYRLLAEFRYVLRRFLAFSERAAQDAGLAPQQHQALLAIKGHADSGAPTIGALAERLAIRHHSAVGLVDRLVEAGFVKRTTTEADRRRVTLSLTRKGEDVLAKLSSAHRAELRRVTPELKPLLAKFEK